MSVVFHQTSATKLDKTEYLCNNCGHLQSEHMVLLHISDMVLLKLLNTYEKLKATTKQNLV